MSYLENLVQFVLVTLAKISHQENLVRFVLVTLLKVQNFQVHFRHAPFQLLHPASYRRYAPGCGGYLQHPTEASLAVGSEHHLGRG